MDFTSITIELLKGLNHITGSYGLAIIALTLLMRFALWPLSVSQQKSMKKMQELGPKMKEIQNRYKSDPQKMQTKMMEFYKENKFNPFGGCLPLLLQMPVFILLYTALSSPLFILASGQSSFLFIEKLYSPIRSHAGQVGDKIFNVKNHDTFSIYDKITVYTNKGVIKNVKVNDAGKAFGKQESIIPEKPLDLKINLDKIELTNSKINKIQKADILVINNNSKEVEELTFKKEGENLVSQVPTVEGKDIFHYDVLALIILFGVTMFFSQKVMTAGNNTAAMDPQQQAMQEQMSKMMPFMITATFIFFPIPAGVLLYMVVSNLFQIVQTVVINKQIDEEANKSKSAPNKVSLNKPVETSAKEVIIEQNNGTDK